VLFFALASAAGKPIKVNIQMIDASRGKCARICVELELHQPVVGCINFRWNFFMLSTRVFISFVTAKR